MSSQSLKSNPKKEIPKGWKIVQIGDHFDFKNGLNKAKEFFGQGTPIINYMDVYPNSSIESKNIRGKVTVTNDELRTFGVRKGDVIFTRTSETIEEIGLSSAVLDDVDKTVFSGFLLRARPKTTLFELEFKKYCFRSKNVRMQIISKSSKTTRALTNGKLLSKVSVLIPNNPQEQKNIAESISDIEKLIEKHENIIEKKRNIKQGTMQELLTGKRRLEGFNKKWTIQSFKKLGQLDSENLSNNTKKDYEFNYISIENVDSGVLKGWIKLKFKNAPSRARKKIRYQDILISTVRPNLKSHLMIKINEPDFICSTGFSVLRCDEKIDPRYVYFHLFANIINTQINNIISGSNYPSINKKDVERLEIPIPSEKREQIAISNTLSDMDSEIKELETKRDKYIMIKNGMMEKLLTGEIRLT